MGAGGFATVYRAYDPELDSAVAVKVLADNWAGDAEIRDRFVREARLLRRIDSDRVVTVHDIGELATGQPYLVMALVEGGTLEARLAGLGELGVAALATLADEVAACLDAVHARQLIHRDLKPHNLLVAPAPGGGGVRSDGELLAPGERLVLADFGLAKDIAMERSGAVTISAGSHGYAAPEQMALAGAPSAKTDLYAATGVVYRAATGEVPPPFDIVRQVVPFPDAPMMAGPRGEFFRAGMAYDPTHRHDDVVAWHRHARAALAGTGTGAPATASSTRIVTGPPPDGSVGAAGQTGFGRWIFAAALVAVAALALLVGAGFLLWPRGEGPEIIGPSEIVAGQFAVYEARLDGVDEYEWIDWNGDISSDDRFRVEAVAPGSLTFSVVGIDGDGGRSEPTERQIEILESPDGPRIVGPELATVGENAVYTAEIPDGATDPRWIDPTGTVAGPSYSLRPSAPGEWRVTLIVTSADGVDIGTSRTIDLAEPGE